MKKYVLFGGYEIPILKIGAEEYGKALKNANPHQRFIDKKLQGLFVYITPIFKRRSK